MSGGSDNCAATTLVFDDHLRLSAIFKSLSEASAVTGILRQSLIKAAYGETVQAGGRYWRVVPRDFEIEPGDIGELSLLEFDSTVGEDRRIYASRKKEKKSIMLESEYEALAGAKDKKR